MNNGERYRRSIRLQNYDYSQPGGYYLTIVTFQREHLFGAVVNGEVTLNEAGKIVWDIWQKLPERYPNIVTDQAVVMPNHFHGTLFITDGVPVVGAFHETPLRRELEDETPEEYRLRRRRMLLPKVVGYFKMNTAKAINLLLNSTGIPIWQRNYYEHIIRSEEDLERIRNYIYYNPQQWEDDEENR
jgi:REP element-mobilizing transposase RayT